MMKPQSRYIDELIGWDAYAKFDLLIDNKKAAAIANGKEIQLPIVAGQHIIQMGGAFLKPKSIEINLFSRRY